MNKEQQPLSFEQLVQRHDQLQARLERKQSLREEEIPSRFKKVDPDDFRSSIKLAKANARLEKDMGEIQSSLARNQEESTIWMETHGPELIAEAQSYTEDIALKKGQLKEMEGLAATGYLPKDVLEMHRGRFRIQAGRPGLDPALKLGIELLQKQIE